MDSPHLWFVLPDGRAVLWGHLLLLLCLQYLTPPPSRFCNCCVRTTLALLRSLHFPVTEPQTISPLRSGSCFTLELPRCFFTNPKEAWPHHDPLELPKCFPKSANAGVGEEASICVSLFWRLFSTEKKKKKPFFALFQPLEDVPTT